MMKLTIVLSGSEIADILAKYACNKYPELCPDVSVVLGATKKGRLGSVYEFDAVITKRDSAGSSDLTP